MTVILRVLHVTGHGRTTLPVWLLSADVDAHDGGGSAGYTTDRDAALQFDDAETALAYWNQTSTVRPVRDDGRPNRPLTALTIEMENYP